MGEFVSKQERRRRLRSSCSESEELVKQIVPYVPRIELPEIENDEKLKSKVNSVSTQIDHNIDVLHEALRSGDKTQVKESVTTIIEEVTYLLEVIEYRFVRIQKIPDNTQRENEYKILYIEIQFVIRKLTILENISEKTDVLSPDILQNINESMNNAKQHIDNFETVQKHNLPEDEENRNLQVTAIESPKYDMHSIEEAECLYQAYLAGNKNNDNKDNSDIVSYASVVASGPTEVTPEADIDPTEDRSFILLKTKTIKVVVEDDMDTRPRSFENETDEEGFTEYVSKQERRRRLQSSCSDDDSIKDLVPYVPRIELPEIEVCEEESMPLINESLTEKSIKVSISEEPETDRDDREEIQNEVEDEVLKIEESKKLKFIDDSQRKRQRTPISESEQEVDDILRLMNREEALQMYGSQESFWHEKWIAEDSECRYHELQTLNLKSPYLQTDSKTGVIDDIISHEGNIGTKVKSLDFHSVDEEEQSANFTDDTNVMIKSTLSPYAAEFVMPSECFVFSSGVGQSPVPDAEFIETQISQEYPSSQPVTCLESSHKLQPISKIDLTESSINEEKLKSKVNSVSTQIDHNIDVLHEALRSGDKAQVKESVTTIIEEVTYLLEVIEYRFVRIQKIPDNTQRENEYKILYIEIQFVIRKLTTLENVSEKTDVLSPDILQNINESINNAKQHIDKLEMVQGNQPTKTKKLNEEFSETNEEESNSSCQQIERENKSNRIYLDISHKRHRSRSRMSDAEQEVDDIL